MKKEPIYVAFATQKGGAGKTTLTVLVASYLHYVTGYNAAVIDCDFPQHSIVEMRARDLRMATDDEYYKWMAYEQFTRLGKKAYPIIASNAAEALADADHLIPQGDFDFIFFDLPGTVNSPGMFSTLMNVDYIIAPIVADRVVAESTLNYLIALREQIEATGKTHIKEIRLLWNLVDGREKSELYEVYEAVIEELEFKILKTFIPDSKRYRREQSIGHRALFRSTLFPADKSLVKGSNLNALVDELLELFNVTGHE